MKKFICGILVALVLLCSVGARPAYAYNVSRILYSSAAPSLFVYFSIHVKADGTFTIPAQGSVPAPTYSYTCPLYPFYLYLTSVVGNFDHSYCNIHVSSVSGPTISLINGTSPTAEQLDAYIIPFGGFSSCVVGVQPTDVDYQARDVLYFSLSSRNSNWVITSPVGIASDFASYVLLGVCSNSTSVSGSNAIYIDPYYDGSVTSIVAGTWHVRFSFSWDFVEVYSLYLQITSGQQNIINTINTGIGTIKQALVDNTATLTTAINKIPTAITNSGNTITAKLGDVITAINGISVGTSTPVVNAITSSGQNTVSAIGSQTTSLSAKLDSVVAAQQKAAADIATNATQNQQAISNKLDSVQSAVTDSVDSVGSTISDQFKQEVDSATKAGDDISGFVDNLQTKAKDHFDILFYPQTFATQILEVFSEGMGAQVISDAYDGIVGYRYDADLKTAVPVYANTRDASSSIPPLPDSGTVVSFPSFTLKTPSGDFKLWDKYDYDLAQLKEQVPVVFDALYIFIGVLELYWFVNFLISIFHEIFD